MIDVLLLALALSMDAFAVCLTLGMKYSKNAWRIGLRAGAYFGFFQAFMPFIGYMGGEIVQKYIGGYDKLIACILLSFIGLKMIKEAYEEGQSIKELSSKTLVLLALATSIDALAVGMSLHLFSLNAFMSMFLIGLITFIISFLGVMLGKKSSQKYKKNAEILGGIILISIGLKIILT